MAFLAALLGAGASVAGSALSQPKTQSTLTRGQKDISLRLAKFFQGQFHPYTDKQGHEKYAFGTATPYGGDFLGALLPQYGQALDLLGQYRPAQQAPYQDASPQMGMWKGALSGAPSYQAKLDPTTTARYFESAVTNPMLHTFNTQIAPQIAEGFAGVGAFSSRQGETRGRALSDLQSSLTGQLGQFQLANQQEQERLNAQLADAASNRALQALQAYGQQKLQAGSQRLQYDQQAMGFANQPLLASGAISSVLQPLQQRQDQNALAQYQDFLRTTPEQSPYLNQMLGYIGQQQQALVQQPNYLSQAIAGAGGGLGVWQALGQQNNAQIIPTQNYGYISPNDYALAQKHGVLG